MRLQTDRASFRLIRGGSLGITAVMSWPLCAMATEGAGQPSAPPFSDLGWTSLKMAGALLLVLGLIAVLFFLAKRLKAGPFRGGPAPAMRLVGSLGLAPKRSVALVEVQGQWLLLGVGTEAVTYLAHVDPEAVPGEGEARHGGFEGILKDRLFGGKRPRSSGKGDHGAS